MAKYQYRLVGHFDGASSPGNAVIALANRGSSGKRVTIRSIEATLTNPTSESTTAGNMKYNLGRGEHSGGVEVYATPMDSSVPTPSGLKFYVSGTFLPDSVLNTAVAGNSLYTAVAYFGPGFAQRTTGGGRFLGMFKTARQRHGSSGVERHTAASGETLGMSLIFAGRPALVRVEAVVRVAAGGTFALSETVFAGGDGACLFALVNGSAGDVELVSVGTTMLGSAGVTPYLQVVPFATVAAEIEETPSNIVALIKMDSASPDPTSWVKAIKNTPLFPLGVPSVYAAPAGGAAPKGFNYLGTKDFLGPVYRAYFPEMRTLNQFATARRGDALAYSMSHRGADLFGRRAGITIRPGEGIAIVATAESATGSSPPSVGGETPIEFAIMLDVENLVQPYLTLTNLETGSDIVILAAGTDTILQQIDAYSGTSWSWAYDPDLVTSIDVCVYKTGSVPLAIRNVSAPSEGVSIPVAQTPDRNFS